MSKPEKYVIVIQESVIASVVKDAATFIMFAGLLTFNHKVLSGNGWIDAIFIMFAFLWLLGRQSKYTFSGTVTSTIKWLEEKQTYPSEEDR